MSQGSGGSHSSDGGSVNSPSTGMWGLLAVYPNKPPNMNVFKGWVERRAGEVFNDQETFDNMILGYLDDSNRDLNNLVRTNESLRTQIGIVGPEASSARPQYEIDAASTTADKDLENADYTHIYGRQIQSNGSVG
nr:hypothetical protein L204_05260 [Cryptococcus depauperatus CBS 7855]